MRLKKIANDEDNILNLIEETKNKKEELYSLFYQTSEQFSEINDRKVILKLINKLKKIDVEIKKSEDELSNLEMEKNQTKFNF
jgi:hypothetical protein